MRVWGHDEPAVALLLGSQTVRQSPHTAGLRVNVISTALLTPLPDFLLYSVKRREYIKSSLRLFGELGDIRGS